MRLTREERSDLFQGRVARIVRDEKPDCVPSQVIDLSANVAITVTAIKRTKAGAWRVDYRLRDDRPRLLRSVPRVFEPPELDQHGDPLPPSTEAIEAARRDGSYTSSPHGALTDAGEAVDDETLNRFTKEARVRWAEQRDRRQMEELANQQAKQLARKLRKLQSEAAALGVDLTPRLVAMIRDAEAELATHRADSRAA